MSPRDDGWGQLTLADAIDRAWSHRRLVIGLPLAVAVITAIVVMLIPKRYDASTSFMAEQGGRGGLDANLSGLAAQAGIVLGSPEGKTPLYYAAVLRSREVMEEVLRSKFARGTGADSATLLELWDVEGETNSRVQLDEGVRLLNERMNVAVDRQVGSVTVTVRDRNPQLAADIANRLVDNLNRFNLERRQSRAQRRREFVQTRSAEALSQLNNAEGALRSFQERNRQWRSSPALELEHERLRRQIDLSRDVYLSLRREFETARMDEVNDMPVITVLDRAVPPVRKSFPPRTLIVIAATLIAGLIALFLALLAGDRIAAIPGLRVFSPAHSRTRPA